MSKFVFPGITEYVNRKLLMVPAADRDEVASRVNDGGLVHSVAELVCQAYAAPDQATAREMLRHAELRHKSLTVAAQASNDILTEAKFALLKPAVPAPAVKL